MKLYLEEIISRLVWCYNDIIIKGCGGGIANLAAVVRLTDYFKKQRAFAMGIGSSGVGLGAFVFTIFQQYLLDEYGWKVSLFKVCDSQGYRSHG